MWLGCSKSQCCQKLRNNEHKEKVRTWILNIVPNLITLMRILVLVQASQLEHNDQLHFVPSRKFMQKIKAMYSRSQTRTQVRLRGALTHPKSIMLACCNHCHQTAAVDTKGTEKKEPNHQSEISVTALQNQLQQAEFVQIVRNWLYHAGPAASVITPSTEILRTTVRHEAGAGGGVYSIL